MDQLGAKPAVAIFRSPLFMPSETFVRTHIAGLRRYRPVVVGLQDRGNSAGEMRRLMPETVPERLAVPLLGWVDGLARRVAAERPALVHAHFGTDGLLALPLAERLGVPLVTTLHGFEVSRHRARLLLSGRLSWMRYAVMRRRLFDRGAQFLAVSEAVRRRALRLGFPEERTITHHNGVDTAFFRPGGEAEPGLVLHVGRLVEKKGTRALLDAMAKVGATHPDARLAIIGNGPLRPSLERHAAALGLGSRVRFLGALPQTDVRAWMQRAWLLAAPSLTARDGDSEGLPTVICEAAAAGLPVVATAHSGIPEAVIDGRTGFLVPEGAADPLAARIGDLIADAGLRTAMAGAARDLAEDRFDAARQIARLETLYDRLVHGTERHAACA